MTSPTRTRLHRHPVRRAWRVTGTAAAGLALLLALGACADSDRAEVETTAGDTAATTEREPAISPEGSGVDVGLTEFTIDMPHELPAGSTTFRVTNAGTIPHNIEIEGQGIERELERNLSAGQGGTLTVELEPGTYEVYCPVADHAERGMRLELTVTEPATER